MSDNSSEEDDRLTELQKVSESYSMGGRFSSVSGWDDDDAEGIEDERNPEETVSKEILAAAEYGDIETVKRLLKENSSLVHSQDKDGYTPLHRACYNNNVEIVNILLDNGADHSAKTEDNWQPLHSACKWNNVDCAAKLLAYGADINAVTTGGLTPLHLAAGNSYAKDTLELLLLDSNINPDIKNNSNEVAFDIARRSGKHYRIFEMTQSCFKI